MRVYEVAEKIEGFCPLGLQESWDNSGFQVKLDNREISKVLVSMEVTEDVIDEAVSYGAKLIITHHPLLFSPLKAVDCNDITGNYVYRLIKEGISVYSTHTPFDKCRGGNNDYLAKLLHLIEIKLMENDESGFCRVGLVDGDCSVLEYIEQISNWLKLDRRNIHFTGSLGDKVEKVGICTGAGSEFFTIALEAGCDLFITGDVKYHQAQLAKEMGMNLLDLGHFGTENIFTENMAAHLRNCTDLEIIESKVNLNPFVVF